MNPHLFPRAPTLSYSSVRTRESSMEQLHNKDWVKSLWTSCKEKSGHDSLWSRVSEMVGYFNQEEGRNEPLPVGADCTLSPLLPPGEPNKEEAKRVVCSPDLPVVFQPAPSEEAPPDSSTAETFNCSFCQKSFSQKNAYQNHLKTHTKDGEDPYQCNFCGKTFAVPARLTRHYRTHTGEKPYQCEICKKSFSVKENLSVHRRIHTKERPYKCDICERAFEHSGKLHRHMRIHTGERPHKCVVCNKTFIQSGQLVIHMRTHTGEKPYVCKDCGKGFTCSKQLKVHNRTHTGERPYSCEICGKSFGYNHVLKLHQVAHYGEKVYKCTICNETFTSKKSMEGHIKSHSENQGREGGGGEEASCASSASDKENKDSPKPAEYPNITELCGYLYRGEKPGGLDPALLAAVAVATSENSDEYRPSPEHVLETPGVSDSPVYLVPTSNRSHSSPSPQEEEDARETISLPPRKRSKAILKSMEREEAPPVRYSVIHYAKAS